MKTILISGGNSGLGLQAVRDRLTDGRRLVLLGRDSREGEAAPASFDTMRSADRALLACDVWAEDEDLDPKYYQELIDSPPRREFRTAPAAVHDVHANLSIANVDFEEIAQAASDDPEGVLRPL
ncbi:hypothetical protein NRF20_42855 [Streptomyces sp. R-74717]|uniref:DUF6924 domain-containing protein n=1 Tax=Streptomyces TaxID=1883 RepID=UPI0037B07C11